MGIRPISRLILVCSGMLGLAGDAGAGDFYLTGNLAISTGTGDSGGSTDFFALTGSDTDSAPACGGAVGFGFKLSEAIPKSWEAPLPGWGVRFEFEGMTGREYELLTNGGDGFISEVKAWTFMPKLGIDVPLHPPIAWIPPSEDPFVKFTMDLAAHELNFGVRVNFYSIPYPEKWAIRADAR